MERRAPPSDSDKEALRLALEKEYRKSYAPPGPPEPSRRTEPRALRPAEQAKLLRQLKQITGWTTEERTRRATEDGGFWLQHTVMDVVEYYEEVEHVRTNVSDWGPPPRIHPDTLPLVYSTLQAAGFGARFQRARLALRPLGAYFPNPADPGPSLGLPEFLTNRAAVLAFGASSPSVAPEFVTCRALEVLPERRKLLCRGEEELEPVVVLQFSGTSGPDLVTCTYSVAALCLYVQGSVLLPAPNEARPTSRPAPVRTGIPRTVLKVPKPGGTERARKRPRPP